MNTKIEYMYRDANNYKKFTTVILEGELTPEEIQQILDCRNEGEFFIAQQIGLPENRFDSYDPESDHPWMTLCDDAFSLTEASPTMGVSAKEILSRFLSAKNNWKPDEWVPD